MDKTLLPLANHGITLAEVPSETALFLEIGLCEIKCLGCHSPHLTCRNCEFYTDEQVENLINSYLKNYPAITAVVFMGGLHNTGVDKQALRKLIERIRVPVCIYSGKEEDLKELAEWNNLKWLKTGAYVARLGGIEDASSNQHFYEKKMNIIFDKYGVYYDRVYYWEDITYKFRKGV